MRTKANTNRRREGKLDGFVRYRNTSIIISIVVIAAVLLFVRDRMKQNIYVEARADSFYLKSYDGQEEEILYSDLTGIDYAETLDLGTLISGTDDRKAKSGTWENASYGQYQLYALPEVTEYIVLKTADSVTVFNYEGIDTTRQLYQAFQQLIEKKGLQEQVVFSGSPEGES